MCEREREGGSVCERERERGREGNCVWCGVASLFVLVSNPVWMTCYETIRTHKEDLTTISTSLSPSLSS